MREEDGKSCTAFLESNRAKIKRLSQIVLDGAGCGDPTSHGEEVGQEVCVNVLTSWHRLKSPEAAINTITRHAALTHARKCRREQATGFREESDDEDDGNLIVPPEVMDPSEIYEHVITIRDLMAQLDETDKAIVSLKFEGLKFREMEAVLGINSATLRSRYTRAIAKLKAAIGATAK